jgi:hypothetical protein
VRGPAPLPPDPPPQLEGKNNEELVAEELRLCPL